MSFVASFQSLHLFHHSLFLYVGMISPDYRVYLLIGFYVKFLVLSDFSYSYVQQTKLASSLYCNYY